MKKAVWFVIPAVLIVIVICVLVGVSSVYTIRMEDGALSEAVRDYLGEHREQVDQVTVHGEVSIGRRMYRMIEADDRLGYVCLEKGPFGKYKIEYARWGSGDFREGILEIGGSYYLFAGGRDQGGRIARIVIPVGDEVYELSIPEHSDHYLVCTEAVGPSDPNTYNRSGIVFYDSQGTDITADYDLKGGSFLE